MVSKEKKPESAAAEYAELRDLFRHHIESFDHMIEKGLQTMFEHIRPVEIENPHKNKKMKIWFDDPVVHQPLKGSSSKAMRNNLFPHECRQAKGSYTGTFSANICFQYDDGPVIRENTLLGQFPIMLMSKLCHLRGADPQKLVSYKEESSEMGGYFILNGIERVVRLLIMPKRNYPMSMVRDSFRDRREGFSDKAVLMRCVREDQSSVTVKLYYLQSGSASFGFWTKNGEILLPVGIVLKALIDTTDHEIYTSLTCCYSEKHAQGKGVVGTQLLAERAKIILDDIRHANLITRQECLQYIGKPMNTLLGLDGQSSSMVGETVLRDYIFVHLDNNHDKFNLLIFMLQKLFSLVDQTSLPDNPDALHNQEVLLPGQLIIIHLKDRLEHWLQQGKVLLQDEIKDKGKDFDSSFEHVKKVIHKKYPARQIGSAIENLLRSGKLVLHPTMDLQQDKGYTVQAERLNFLRFLSHFRAVHRGASFAGLRTTTVRKLLPESWGFLCPVHTPDGEPCGLLNHMTSTCRISSFFDSKGNTRDFMKIRLAIVNVLISVGMTSSIPRLVQAGPPVVLSVLLDGRVIGTIAIKQVQNAVNHLRVLKMSSSPMIPDDLEVGYVPLSFGAAYPGLYIFTNPSRFVRPVRNLLSKGSTDIEFIGPFEQVFMEIKCPDGIDGGRKEKFPATHEEIHPTGILSVVANLTPWSDHNQSPRNMYQCQMAKQTMAFSTQAIHFRADQKLYHLQTPQTPIVRTKAYTKFCIDEHPTGTNAIVAVLAYTGYDMEDAMILNKSSVERGMFHGQIYETETIDLSDTKGKFGQGNGIFRRSNTNKSARACVDSDGLPYVGQILRPKDPYYSIYDEVNFKTHEGTVKGSETVIVDYVSVDTKTKKPFQKANIRLRHPRNPIIGDKFSSRHGQKGVCSQLWPDIDMPFSGVTGMRPDLIINPHAFPSRMTIAMLLESIAAKAGSLDGEFVDATPFASSVKKDDEDESESESIVDQIGDKLRRRGFNYLGVEMLYSGVYGTELTCEIFVGPVYYQRLRHMVSDKFQVRSTGRRDQVTHQPIKGRKQGGGIRFGEMERDSMLAHGAAYLLHDRLDTCSDKHIADVCSICGSILAAEFIQPQSRTVVGQIAKLPTTGAPRKVSCLVCKTSKGMETVVMPYVFRYLAAELAAMNIQMTLNLSKNAAV
ncbi:hypothetical protein MLD38_008837 [Melastoma candidum]|uniref:Uncharacterized protein n=1 Tax=Melastoma candidum TaxID=119954 RepID=A0ACB9RXK2_9MYRT|nr:hypothetical protein MLD38_008837 [Melastoma candidum]